METKASYIFTGAFTLAVIAGVFGFVYWVQSGGTSSDRATYRVRRIGFRTARRLLGSVRRHAGRRGDQAYP
jgi:hypothetical protein